jgi:hypothetical protein
MPTGIGEEVTGAQIEATESLLHCHSAPNMIGENSREMWPQSPLDIRVVKRKSQDQ